MENTTHSSGANRNSAPDTCSTNWKWARILGIFLLALFFNQNDASAVAAPGGHSVKLAWDADPASEVIGYRVYYGTTSGTYAMDVDVGNVTTSTISGLASGTTYYFAVASYDAKQLESDYSNEINFTPGAPAVRFAVSSQGQPVLAIQGTSGRSYVVEATEDFATWTIIHTVTLGSGGTAQFTDTNAVNFPKRFYRIREI